MQRFLVSSQDTSHVNYPSSGISKQVCDLGGYLREGERWGEQGLARGVPPLLQPVQCLSRATQRRLDAPARFCSNGNQRRDLPAERSGRRSLPPAVNDAIGETVNGSTVA
jgi:hypothetical protein